MGLRFIVEENVTFSIWVTLGFRKIHQNYKAIRRYERILKLSKEPKHYRKFILSKMVLFIPQQNILFSFHF